MAPSPVRAHLRMPPHDRFRIDVFLLEDGDASCSDCKRPLEQFEKVVFRQPHDKKYWLLTCGPCAEKRIDALVVVIKTAVAESVRDAKP